MATFMLYTFELVGDEYEDTPLLKYLGSSKYVKAVRCFQKRTQLFPVQFTKTRRFKDGFTLTPNSTPDEIAANLVLESTPIPLDTPAFHEYVDSGIPQTVTVDRWKNPDYWRVSVDCLTTVFIFEPPTLADFLELVEEERVIKIAPMVVGEFLFGDIDTPDYKVIL